MDNYVILSFSMKRVNRREFLKYSALFTGAAAGGVSWGAEIEPNRLITTSYDLASAKWELSPLHIVFAGDFHVGCPSVDLQRMEMIATQINKMKPDIVFLLGDFLTGRDHASYHYVPPQEIADTLGYIKAPLGNYAVLGNHDWSRNGQGMWKALEKKGIQVLENDAVQVRRQFWVAGLADDTTRMPDINATMAKVSTNDPVILLMHDPGTFLDKPDGPVISLAGHTHGGQVNIPLVGMTLRPAGRVPRRWAYGHIVEEGREMIVTSGIGTSNLPIRFNAPPEIVSLKIRPAL